MKAAPAADGANEGFSVLLESGRGGRTRTRDLRFWRLVAVSAMPAYLVARALCAKTAGVWTGIIPRDCLAGGSCCGGKHRPGFAPYLPRGPVTCRGDLA